MQNWSNVQWEYNASPKMGGAVRCSLPQVGSSSGMSSACSEHSAKQLSSRGTVPCGPRQSFLSCSSSLGTGSVEIKLLGLFCALFEKPSLIAAVKFNLCSDIRT